MAALEVPQQNKVEIVTIEDLRRNRDVQVLIQRADQQLDLIGYTEHGYRHASLVANIAQNVLLRLKYPERAAQLAAIAGYLHDIGNVVTRFSHAQMSALLAHDILIRMGMDIDEVAVIMGAVGNHEEDTGAPISDVAAAVIIADKSDVHRSRVRNPNMAAFDIHDRVNYASEHSFVRVDESRRMITLEMTIDNHIADLMAYFEIFLSRMLFIRRAAEFLNCRFELVINKRRILEPNANGLGPPPTS
jgi:metal-dependent HD superfamily phosphatase/phosphodiesterase